MSMLTATVEKEQAYVDVAAQLRRRLNRVRSENERLRAENRSLHAQVKKARSENEQLRAENRRLHATLAAYVNRACSTAVYGPVEMTAGTCVGPRRRT